MTTLILDRPLTSDQIHRIACHGATLALSDAALARIDAAHAALRTLVDGDRPVYGLNTGVGALSDTRISAAEQTALSRKILFSHAVGVGTPLDEATTRAIVACAINGYCHGRSGIRADIVLLLVRLLNANCLPVIPRDGSVGYLSHMAHVALPLIGHGALRLDGETLPAREALRRLDLAPVTLGAKEGLCLVNGLPCATGIGALVTTRLRDLMDWADCIAAVTFDVLGGQVRAFDPRSARLRAFPGSIAVADRLTALLAGSPSLARSAGARTQDALSLRAIPQVHGAARDALAGLRGAIDLELQSLSDNPAIVADGPAIEVFSEAHAVGAALAQAMDQSAIVTATLGGIAERRLDRMVNPLVSPWPPFLATDPGTGSGFMIAQYTAASLVAQNRRLAAPASLDGGITSALQEDILVHATPAALKAATIVDNTRTILAIELLAACQCIDLAGGPAGFAPRTADLFHTVRALVPRYDEDHPLADDITGLATLLSITPPPAL
ncbi:HAL/PAL/TAL family ammonia-lyase [Gluconacetobacter tumulisoli]|uniref:Histidine ammonia-lyase n=1 Tax=Gluconacetobacter tumulisoli TaxID=1286189 RepID=A0A7W4K5C0_9PROT|nr:histidine ammonia-lyase [Gluconacetobacter tumulisoli]MBB2200671.1 histidine ammonia-lyase [Gluconacetobacter tumulisoli]